MVPINLLITSFLATVLASTISFGAGPKKDQRKDKARCDSQVSLCKDVAAIEQRNSKRAKLKNSEKKYDDDVKSCNNDHKTCMGKL